MRYQHETFQLFTETKQTGKILGDTLCKVQKF